jgi:hypothetical protein
MKKASSPYWGRASGLKITSVIYMVTVTELTEMRTRRCGARFLILDNCYYHPEWQPRGYRQISQ